MNHESLRATALLVLLVHTGATFFMIGVVWFVQQVHYPLFAEVASHRFAAYQDAHLSRTGPVVMPAMLVEAATALALIALPIPLMSPFLPYLGLGLLAIVWFSTWFLQVPRHRRLASGFDAAAQRGLVATNWVRTSAWSLRGVIVMWMLLCAASASPLPAPGQ